MRHADSLMDLLKGMLAIGVPLTSAETATYLHNCVSDRWYELGDLDDWNHLDHQLCDTPLDPAGWYPELGKWHLRTMSVQGYPAESTVGIMRQLDALKLACRWSTALARDGKVCPAAIPEKDGGALGQPGEIGV